MEKSGVLLTVIPALMPMRSHAVKLRRLTAEALSELALMEAAAPGIPKEGTVPVLLRGRTHLDRILPARVHTVGVPRTLRAAAEARPAQAPAVPAAAAPALRVRAARVEARAAGRSEPLYLAFDIVRVGEGSDVTAL